MSKKPFIFKKKPGNSTDLWLYGDHAVLAALKNPERQIYKIFATASTHAEHALELVPFKDLLKVVSNEELNAVLPSGAIHQGLAAHVAPLPEASLEELCRSEKPSITLVVLDQVTDPHNVGAILRSAAAFKADAVVMTERHAATLTGTLAKSASGALEVVPLIYVKNLSRALEMLKKSEFWCYGFDERAPKSLARTELSGRIALVFGSEGEGIRHLTRETCDFLIKLPTASHFSTLNVSNSVAVALYEVERQRKEIAEP